MLQAILSGKSGRIPEGVTSGSSWLHALKHSEDLLTSTVFERLAYLDGSLLWKILEGTFGSALPSFRVAELMSIEFWPTWLDPTKGGAGTVEPDVFMEFLLGDPAQRVAVICEAKLGQQQYSMQWQRQWIAYQQKVEIGEASSDRVLFLAIGGLSGHRTQMAERFHQEITLNTFGKVSVNAVAADWSALADAVHAAHQVATGGTLRLLADIAEALSVFGYRHLQALEGISDIPAMHDSAASFSVFKSLDFKND